jgi:hypothetical protein
MADPPKDRIDTIPLAQVLEPEFDLVAPEHLVSEALKRPPVPPVAEDE